MKLAASNKSALTLKIIGYEFPEIEGHRYDSNWLIVEVTVTHPEGSWTASDPSLLTFEVTRLADWLENINDGKKVDDTIYFTEPNI